MFKSTFILLVLAAVTTGAGKPLKNLDAVLTRPDVNQQDPNDISEYYGFGEIEIIKLDYGIRSLQIADFDGDGRNDMAVADNDKAAIDLLLQKSQFGPDEEEVAVDPNDRDINALVGPSRFKRQTIPISQRIYCMVAGDLNSDGLIDLAFYGEPRGLYVLLQQAPSKVEAKPGQQKGKKRNEISWQPRKRINIDDALPSENALVCADIDNDGKKDLILAGRDAIYIVMQKEDGSLAEPVKYAVAAQVIGVDTGDLNGDGKTDLVIYTDEQDRPIHVRLGQKNNQLGPEIRLFAEYPALAELANIDGKAGDELVTIDAVGKRLVCYSFTAGDSAEDDWPVLFYPLPAGQDSQKRDLVIGDVDGDKLTDVVISDPGAAELILYRQAAGVGLAQPARFPSLAEADSLSIADIDGDGKSEVGVLSVKEKAIGISKFEAGRLSFPRSLDLVGEPLAMELTDIDSDGAADCVYISRSQADTRSLRVIYNVAKPNEQVDVNNPPQAELKRLASNPQGIKIVDVDQDGLKDVLVFVKYELPILIRQVEKRKFEVVDSPKAQSSLIKDAMLRSADVANVDGRPGEELLVAQNNFARSMVFKNGSWMVLDQYNAKSAENHVSAVAVAALGDAKGVPSILLLDGQKGKLQILKTGPDKTWRFDRELDVGTWNSPQGIKMMLASLMGGTGQSRRDGIILFDGEKFAIVLSPQGMIRQKLDRKFSYETKIKEGLYGNLTTGDINSDGVVDIIMVEARHNHIEILSLDSTGKPVPAMRFKIFEDKTYRETRALLPAAVEPRELKVADVTGDGKPDLVTVIHDRIIIYPQY